jgi:hypothetical protein
VYIYFFTLLRLVLPRLGSQVDLSRKSSRVGLNGVDLTNLRLRLRVCLSRPESSQVVFTIETRLLHVHTQKKINFFC